MATKAATPAQLLEREATALHSIAFDFMSPARSQHEAEGRIAEVERIASVIRSVVRGGGRQ